MNSASQCSTLSIEQGWALVWLWAKWAQLEDLSNKPLFVEEQILDFAIDILNI